MNILKIKTPKMELGSLGEKMARRYLRRNRYKIRETNFVADGHEIDIIAEDKEALVFVEVKTRTIGHQNPNEPRPASSVDAEKQRGIIKAAGFYAAYNPVRKKKRFDIVEVYVSENNGKYTLTEIKHLKNTFNLNTAYMHAERKKK